MVRKLSKTVLPAMSMVHVFLRLLDSLLQRCRALCSLSRWLVVVIYSESSVCMYVTVACLGPCLPGYDAGPGVTTPTLLDGAHALQSSFSQDMNCRTNKKNKKQREIWSLPRSLLGPCCSCMSAFMVLLTILNIIPRTGPSPGDQGFIS